MVAVAAAGDAAVGGGIWRRGADGGLGGGAARAGGALAAAECQNCLLCSLACGTRQEDKVSAAEIMLHLVQTHT